MMISSQLKISVYWSVIKWLRKTKALVTLFYSNLLSFGRLVSNTKFGKDIIQQIIRGNGPGDLSQMMQGLTEVYGMKFVV